MYKYSKGGIKIALIGELTKGGIPVLAATKCALDSVNAGHVTDHWRKQLGSIIADAIDSDLERMKK